MPKTYFHLDGINRHGPFTAKEIRSQASAGIIRPTHHIQEHGASKAYEAKLIAGLFPEKTPNSVPASLPQSNLATSSTSPQPIGTPQSQVHNPLSTLLNSLTTCVLSILHSQVEKRELALSDFERLGASLLLELQSAVEFTERTAQSQIKLPVTSQSRSTDASNPTAGAAKTDHAKVRHISHANSSTIDLSRSQSETSAPSRAASQQKQGRPEPLQNPPRIASPTTLPGASPLQMGAAALAGGAWGYLLAQQMSNTPSTAGTHIHYHDDERGTSLTPPRFDELSESVNTVYHTTEEPPEVANTIAHDSNGDGLIDSFYTDTNSDGMADIIGIDNDTDGVIDEIEIDRDYDGAFDETFTQEANTPDADDVDIIAEYDENSPDDYEDVTELEDDVVEYEIDDYDDMDFG